MQYTGNFHQVAHLHYSPKRLYIEKEEYLIVIISWVKQETNITPLWTIYDSFHYWMDIMRVLCFIVKVFKHTHVFEATLEFGHQGMN